MLDMLGLLYFVYMDKVLTVHVWLNLTCWAATLLSRLLALVHINMLVVSFAHNTALVPMCPQRLAQAL